MFETAQAYMRFGVGISRARAERKTSLAHRFELQATKQPGRPFLHFEGRTYSYGEANAAVNRHAHAYASLGVGRGDSVAIVMDNRPAFLFHFLALSKLGAAAGLINPHNTGAPLQHALSVSAPKLIIVGSEHLAAVTAIGDGLPSGARVLVDHEQAEQASQTPEPQTADWASRLEGQPDTNPAGTASHPLKTLGAFIYTSGTTGLPKAARMTQLRLYGMAFTMGGLAWNMRPKDVVYNPLPLYHTSGLAVCTGAVIAYGASMVLARRFSARQFWQHIRDHQCTGFVYIGELCRYLDNQPASGDDRHHGVRVAVGNGLRPDIWERFQARFGVPHIREFYGSTEGNVGTLNMGGPAGSVGRLLSRSHALVQWDADANTFVRDPDGRLVRCEPEQPGVLLGRVTDGVAGAYDGYLDAAATEAKIVRNAFKQGDAYFNTGDTLYMDRKRHLYFVDRLGDTFRWKGENVSTLQVQEQLSEAPPVAEVNVYGVQIPGHEGRAGMAALVLQETGQFDPTAFKSHVDRTLPAYARPVLLRLMPAMETTSTLKVKKKTLQEQGFDPAVVKDPLFVHDPAQQTYVPLSPDLHARLLRGELSV